MHCYKLAKWKNGTERIKWDLGDQDRGGNMGGGDNNTKDL